MLSTWRITISVLVYNLKYLKISRYVEIWFD